jgi:Fe-S-cluster containining protein
MKDAEYSVPEVPMAKKDTLFLTRKEALEAICRDFRQYDPQIMLFCQIIRLISGGDIVAKRQEQKNGAWISLPGHRNMRWMGGAEMVEYLCESLEADLSLPVVASICARVFQTRTHVKADSATGQEGISIETGMEDFACRQCGQCCRTLDYHGEVIEEDVALWQELGRSDILRWVGVFKGESNKKSYRIWTTPGTKELAEGCPFLKKISSENRSVCLIQDVKPGICRQYPSSRKHAVMTGCPGFKKDTF